MTAVAFVGNCQVVGLRATAQALLPQAEITAFHVSARRTPREVRAAIRSVDHVVTMIGPASPHAKLLGAASLGALGPKTIYLPPFVFPALHSDIVSLDVGAEKLVGAVGSYHSLIALAAFRLGLPPQRALLLYNAHVFARLGYFERVDAAWAALIAGYAMHGYDLAPHLDRWRAASDPFMHAANHPAIVVLSTLATLALERLGLVARGTRMPDGVEDALARAVVQPVYPEIARRAGTVARVQFLRRPGTGGSDRAVPMPEFVRSCFEVYRDADERAFAHPRVVAAASAISELLSAATYAPPVRSLASAAAI